MNASRPAAEPARPGLVSARALRASVAIALMISAASCARSRGQRWDGGVEEGDGSTVELTCGGDPLDDYTCVRGASDVLYFCEPEQEFYRISQRDCTAEDDVCVAHPPYDDCDSQQYVGDEAIGCSLCRPCNVGCSGGHVARCAPDGESWIITERCDTAAGEACEGGMCVNGCDTAELNRSNVGCEYWAVDLDNAVTQGRSAASQRFAVVVSNPSENNEAHVSIEICQQQPCSDPDNLEEVAFAIVNRRDLEVFELEPREVDGSSPGRFDTGAGTALGPRAYRVTSTWPIIAYQFNPLDNVDVFSNDASLLLPTSALDTRYAVLSWPQTIARAPGEPDFDFEDDLRSFLTVVGVEDDTSVTVETRAAVIPSGESEPEIPFTPVGGEIEVSLNAFDVLNLETGYHDGQHAFLADFTGSVVESDRPVAVFAGSEASGVPIWRSLEERRCCADHLEQQQWPERTLGYSFVVGHTPRRTQVLRATGAVVTPLPVEPEWFRIMAVRDDTVITTTIPGEAEIELDAMEYVTVESDTHFTVSSNEPIAVGQFVGGQETTGIPVGYPGGDPAFILVPPVEQWRSGYVFLTPDKYAFDFVIISVARAQAAQVELDGRNVATIEGCSRERADGLPADDPHLPDHYVITCALSAPLWQDDGIVAGEQLDEGERRAPPYQNDGPHEVYVRGGSDIRGIGIVVYGFDSYVSYGYAGGTDLRIIQ